MSDPEAANMEWVKLYRGADALHFLTGSGIAVQWQELFEACSWATVFQNLHFIRVWYDCYHDQAEPLIAVRFADGKLAAAFAGAVADGFVSGAGTVQAEYHTWLARPGEEDFIDEAVALFARSGYKGFRLQYVAPGAPLEWLEFGKHHWKQRATLKYAERPMQAIGDGSAVETTLKKKNNRYRLRHLEEAPGFRFAQISSAAEWDRLAVGIAELTDFRQGAMHGGMPFRDNPRKAVFFSRLFADAPGTVHGTVIESDNGIVSAQVNFPNSKELILGLVTFSPFWAKHSPGRIHLLLLGRLMVEQNYEWLDLTPSGDYKERFATDTTEVAILEIRFSAASHAASRVRAAAMKRARTTVRKWGLTGDSVRKAVRMISPSLFRRVAGRTKRWLFERTEIRVYRMHRRDYLPQDSQDSLTPRIDSLADLLSLNFPTYQRQRLLSGWLNRFSDGSHSFSYSMDGRLVHYGWFSEQSTSFVTEVQQRINFPGKVAVAWDFFTDPEYRGRGFYSRSLRFVIDYAFTRTAHDYLYIMVDAVNTASRKVIEKAGFTWCGSLIRRRHVGQSECVAIFPADSPEPAFRVVNEEIKSVGPAE